MITLELPWAPTANTYYRRVGHKTLISRAGREYRRQIGKQRMAENWPRFGEAIRLSLAIKAYPPDRRKRDLDNMLKPMLDALEAADLFADDSQIDHLSIERMESNGKPGHVAVTVRPA